MGNPQETQKSHLYRQAYDCIYLELSEMLFLGLFFPGLCALTKNMINSLSRTTGVHH